MAKESTVEAIGVAALVEGPAPHRAETKARFGKPNAAMVAATLVSQSTRRGLTVLLTTSEPRADELGRILTAMTDADVEVLVLPPWDCLPYDHASPSRESQGRRLVVLDRLEAAGVQTQILVVSPEAAMQRLPPQDVRAARFDLRVGMVLDREALAAFARRTGYVTDDRIDEPGEIAFLGEVIDVFPPASGRPVRISVADDTVTSMSWFDPVSQRSEDEVDYVILRGASELHLRDDEERSSGAEHRLAQIAGPLDSLFELVGDATWLAEPAGLDRCRRFLDQIREAYATAKTFGGGGTPPEPGGLYLSPGDLAALTCSIVEPSAEAGERSPFAAQRRPGKALKAYVEEQSEARRRIVFAATEPELKQIGRILKRQGLDMPQPLATWSEVMAAPPGEIVAFVADPGVGFDDATLNLTLLTATDILGGRVAQARSVSQSLIGEPDLRTGDVIIHEDHGLGVLQALERVEIDGFDRDVVRLEYRGGATILAPVEEFGRIWRYGSEPAAVTLDRLGTDGWLKRRAEVSAQIDLTAAQLVVLAAERDQAQTEPITPQRADYAAFTARFPFPESADQAAAIGAVLDDLASGKPMNRLVCGDVGFGKTEVALRAAAVVAMAGRQVVMAAPTTVLARQHFETFRRRFQDSGIEVAQLSRLVDAKGANVVRAGLADGSIRIAVGTHALAAEAIAFADLGLVIIDEEQRFGTKMKQALRARAPHALTLTATPIPRTLQSALVGLLDVSVIASPPSRRRPIRTAMTNFDGASLRTALLREKRRGGQSFIVCPRIEDLAPMQKRLNTLVPELLVTIAHGKMPAADVDEAMVGFADGRGDILLATNIIESGLDVPRANTIVIWRPDRFGLAQLHQLRGRVGRGRAQGFAYLLTEPDDEVGEGTLARLGTLEAFDRLGSGFAISARDLDLRGGGDLVGDDQAGHMKMVGAALYQQVLERAVRIARGEELLPDIAPPRIDASAYLPDEFIPDATMRINLYARLARVTSASEVDALEDEIADRFGPPPPETAKLLTATRMSALAAEAGVTRISSGPKATAFTLMPRRLGEVRVRLPDTPSRRWVDDRLVFDTLDVVHDESFIASVLLDLAA